VEELVTHEASRTNGAAKGTPSACRVLVTGADGFIGSVVTPLLADRGFNVTGLDNGFYRAGLLYHDGRDRPPTLTRDIRTLSAADLDGFDAWSTWPSCQTIRCACPYRKRHPSRLGQPTDDYVRQYW
jgi:NAD dependent epimerase/dehydratase family